MKHLLFLSLAVCSLLTTVAENDVTKTTKESKKSELRLTPKVLISSLDDRLYIKNLENYSRINILSNDYVTFQTFTVYNNSFDISSLKLTPGKYLIQIIGNKTLTQQELSIH
jgi:hypothetical protein